MRRACWQLPDFGEQAAALVSDALDSFDAASATFKGAAPVSAARDALAEQLQRALYGIYRKQVAALQRLTLSKLRAKVRKANTRPSHTPIHHAHPLIHSSSSLSQSLSISLILPSAHPLIILSHPLSHIVLPPCPSSRPQVAATKPAADIEAQLKVLLDEAKASFDTSAKALLPAGVRWTYSFERSLVVESMEDVALQHVQTLQVQGLYLSKRNAKVPVDVAAHWLLPHPFGRDSRYDPVSADDSPAYKPQAATMKLRATDGYRPRSRLTDPKEADPKSMIFTDKMMS